MSGRVLGLLIDKCDQAASYNNFSLHSNSHTKLSEKVSIGSDRNYTFPTESKFSSKQINYLPGLLARWPLFAVMDETNNHGSGDDNEIFTGNDNMTTMTMNSTNAIQIAY